jgi:hypothetical protein
MVEASRIKNPFPFCDGSDILRRDFGAYRGVIKHPGAGAPSPTPRDNGRNNAINKVCMNADIELI